MDVSAVALRIILLITSAASFLPQYLRILGRQDFLGISPTYVFFNLFMATPQFTLFLHLMVLNDISDVAVHSPPSFGDWLNLAQFAVVWIGHLIFFAFYLHYYADGFSTKVVLVVVYVALLVAAFTPIIIESTLPSSRDREWFASLYAGAYMMVINPLATILGILAFFPQAQSIIFGSPPNALSSTGLALQALVFLLVGILWTSRFPSSGGGYFKYWYDTLGWATVDNIVFAVVQGLLFLMLRRRTPSAQSVANSETEAAPLLGS